MIAHIPFPSMILCSYMIFNVVTSRSIHMILLHHQKMSFKGFLLMFFVYTTLENWYMIKASTTNPQIFSQRRSTFNLFKWRTRHSEYIHLNVIPCPFLRNYFPHAVFSFFLSLQGQIIFTFRLQWVTFILSYQVLGSLELGLKGGIGIIINPPFVSFNHIKSFWFISLA